MSTTALAHEVKSTHAPKTRAKESGLRVNPPDDSYEREAESVAEQVMSGRTHKAAWSLSRISMVAPLQRECSCGGSCDECKKKAEETLQRDAMSSSAPPIAPPVVHDVLRGPGAPLDRGTRSFMESRFGYDFSGVRVYNDGAAASSARAVAANAYTVGDKIVFNSGKYAPVSSNGRRLLAHELTHVVQQRGVPSRGVPVQREATEEKAAKTKGEGALRSTGKPLDGGVRSMMERRFGADFGRVRVHTDGEAARSAVAAGAGAYTFGDHIAFASGMYSPETEGGRVVLGHELAHVMQQGRGGGAPDAAAEAEARQAGESLRRPEGLVPVRQATQPGFAAMSIAEARRAMWGYVPDTVKDYVRPAARAAAAEMDKIVPPNTEIPKPVENLVTHPVDTVVNAVEHPVEAAHAVAETVEAVKPVAAKVAAKIVPIVKAKVKKEIHDKVMNAAGTIKGVALEATNLVDTVAWVPHAAHELEKKALGDGATAQMVIAATDGITGYAALSSLVKAGYVAKDPITGKPTGAFSISGTVSNSFDEQADKVDKALGDGKPEQALLFTSYEEGELSGAVGTQVALAFVGAEEAQLALKVAGAIGAIKNVVDAVEADPKGWKTNINFWSGIIMLVLTILGLGAARASKKIVGIIMAGTGLVAIVPLVWQLYQDYKKLPEGPERDKRLKQDFGGIIKALGNLIMTLVQHAGAKKSPSAAEPQAGGSVAEKTPAVENATTQEPAARPAVEGNEPALAKPVPPLEDVPLESAAPTKHVEQTKAAAPVDVPAVENEAKAAVGKGTAAHVGAKSGVMEPETANSPKEFNKSDALAEAKINDPNAAEPHEVIATKDGFGRCSPGPCPAIPIVYRDDLAANRGFAERYQEIRKLGQTDPVGASEKIAKLVTDIESARRQATAKNFPEHTDPDRATGKEQWKRMEGERRTAAREGKVLDAQLDKMELGVGKDRLKKIQSGEKNFVLDRALTFDIDEVLPVGARDIKPQRAVSRALDASNRQLLDPHTNRTSKGLGIDPRELKQNRPAQPQVSVTADPSAIVTKRFSEVVELKNIFDQAVASVKEPQTMSPTELKAAINKETRRIITEGNGPDAIAVRKALNDIGFERLPGSGWTMMKSPPPSVTATVAASAP